MKFEPTHAGYRQWARSGRVEKFPCVGGLGFGHLNEDSPDGEGVAVTAEGRIFKKNIRVKTRRFFDLVNHEQGSLHEIPADRIRDLNRLIIGEIEVVSP